MKRIIKKTKRNLRQTRRNRVRAKVSGTAERPRLSVFRSLRHTSAQLIDDACGKVICAAHSRETKAAETEGRTGKTAKGFLTGCLLAERAAAKGIKQAVLDRAGYRYHGRVAAVADGARRGGLQF